LTSAWPDYTQDQVFGRGREGQILLAHGGTLELKSSDEVAQTNLGIVIKHGDDKYDTMTFVPFTNIAWVRTKELSPGKRGLEKIREEQRSTHQQTELPEPRYLGEGEWSDGS
jgi:hypothetical protein